MTSEKEGVSGFFESKGAIGLVARMDPEEGDIVSDLEAKLEVSGKTLTGLLSTAEENGLIREVTLQAGDHARSTRYALTSKGRLIQSFLRDRDIDELHQEYIDRKRQLDAIVTPLQEALNVNDIPEEYDLNKSWEMDEERRLEVREKYHESLEEEWESEKELLERGDTEPHWTAPEDDEN